MRRRFGTPPLPSGAWPRGRKLASFCRRLKESAENCGHAGSPCRQTAIDRALAASCPWAIKRITPRYSGRLVKD